MTYPGSEEMVERTLTLEDVARYPRPGTTVPRRVEFTPDGGALAYLHSAAGTLVQQLWLYDIAWGERRAVGGASVGSAQSDEQLSIEEKLHRERARVRELGVTDYQFASAAPDGERVLLVPFAGALHVARGASLTRLDSTAGVLTRLDGTDGVLTRLDGTEGALDGRLSPDGSRVAFVRGGELYAMPSDGSAPPRRLTSGAGDGVTNGLAEYVAQEEMGRREGYWWSPEGTRIAYVRADSGHIPLYPIVHQGAEPPSIEEHRYPFSGARNAMVRLGVVAVAGAERAADATAPGTKQADHSIALVGERAADRFAQDGEQQADGAGPDGEPVTTWMDLGADVDIYLTRVAWRPDGVLTALIESRDQRTLRLLSFDPRSGAATTLLQERGEPWLNLGDELRFLASGELIWPSERSGFRHLYLRDAGGALRALTDGEWVVTGLAAVDEQRRVAYLHGTRDGALERHLYAVPLDGGAVRRVTAGAGTHDAVISSDFRHYVDTFSYLDGAPTVTLRNLEDGSLVAVLSGDAATASDHGLCAPELTSFRNRDGVELFAAVYASPATRASGLRAPLIVSVYGGPHAQQVRNSWDLTVDLRAQYLAQQGFVVLKVDNRGSANRGLAFEAALARDMGHLEIEDQVDGVRFIAQRPYVDGTRVGIYGWSYGGYLTCMALLRAPAVFKAGVAGAPVTEWQGYDTFYTERYMGRPQDNETGYHTGSVLSHVEALRGKLLIIHGMVDENVHLRHTTRLIAALTAANRPYDLVLFPEERHMPRDAHGLEYLERRLTGYLQAHL